MIGCEYLLKFACFVVSCSPNLFRADSISMLADGGSHSGSLTYSWGMKSLHLPLIRNFVLTFCSNLLSNAAILFVR